jgi:phenylacetic acid degradation protein
VALYEFEGKRPKIGAGSFIPESADVVGNWAIIGEGAVVRGEIPDGKIAVGIPAKVIGEVKESHKQEWIPYKEKYARLARERYPAGLKRIDPGKSRPERD